MKKQIIIVLLIAIPLLLSAQTATSQKEIGLQFRNLNSFGFNYKTGTSTALWRFTAIGLSGQNQKYSTSDQTNKSTSNGFSVGVGKEWRKPLNTKLEMRWGLDLAFGYDSHKQSFEYTSSPGSINRLDKQTIYSPGVNFVFGFNYLISKEFILGAEILPFVNYRFGKSKTDQNGTATDIDVSQFTGGFDTNSVALTLAYRF